MGFFRRYVGLDFVDTVLHVFVTGCVALGANEMAGTGSDGGAVAAVFAASAVWFGIRRTRAMAQRPPEVTGETTGQQRVQELETRVAELEYTQHRVAELEERLDFAERLLAQRAEPIKLEEPR